MNRQLNEKDRKFQNKMSFLQSVIGIHDQPSYSYLPAQIRERDRKILAQQALTFNSKQKGWLERLNNSWIHSVVKLITHRSKQSLGSSRTHVH
jgi:hypothetical protein